MRACLMIEGQEDVAWEQWVALARACEESGIETLFRSDHYLSVQGERSRGSLDAWATLNALAAITSRLRLGTLVSPATFRHPSLLVGGSGGRRSVALAARWADVYNMPFARPDRCREVRRALPEAMPLSVMIDLDDATPQLMREYEAAGVERVMLQHLRHTALDAVARVGRERAGQYCIGVTAQRHRVSAFS